MSWILIAIFAYFLVSIQVILDKFLLTSKKVSHPSVYAFYSGALSITAFALIPFGARLVSFDLAAAYILAGGVFALGVLLLFFAIETSQASRVTPVVGAVTPAVTFFLAYLFSGESLNPAQAAGIAALIFGGLLISFDLPLKFHPRTLKTLKKFIPLNFITSLIFTARADINRKKFFSGFYYSIAAGIMFAVAFTAFKKFYADDGGFVNVFLWTRLGMILGSFCLFFHPEWRRAITRSWQNFRKPQKESVETGGIFVANKALGGVGSILTNYAVALGSVTIVNAMIAFEYVVIFLLGLIFSAKFPRIFQEKWEPMDILQKVAAIAVITAGIVAISM